jgi:hypothetical protein
LPWLLAQMRLNGARHLRKFVRCLCFNQNWRMTQTLATDRAKDSSNRCSRSPISCSKRGHPLSRLLLLAMMKARPFQWSGRTQSSTIYVSLLPLPSPTAKDKLHQLCNAGRYFQFLWTHHLPPIPPERPAPRPMVRKQAL